GCLESLAEGDMWPAVVLVLDQSTGETVAGIVDRVGRSGLAVAHVMCSETGIAAGTNRGIERSTTSYIAVTHDDCRVSSTWVRMMAERLPTLGQALVTGRVEPLGDGANPTIITSTTPRVHRAPQLHAD